MNTGKYGAYKRLEDWRYNQLKLLGIEGSYSNVDFDLKDFKKHPVFYKGMLATDVLEKGPILGAWLDKMDLKPNSIFAFDDDLTHLNSIQEECSKREIKFIGYHYKGYKAKPWDEELAKIQAEYLIKHKKWLSDKKAKQLMFK